MTDDITRRSALRAGATVMASAAAVGVLADAAEAENLRRFEQQSVVDPKHRILFKGGTIISRTTSSAILRRAIS
jgi:hypothetical protein